MHEMNTLSSVVFCAGSYVLLMLAIGIIATRRNFRYAAEIRENIRRGLYERGAPETVHRLMLYMVLAWVVILGLLAVIGIGLLYDLDPVLVQRVASLEALRIAAVAVGILGLLMTGVLGYLLSRMLNRRK